MARAVPGIALYAVGGAVTSTEVEQVVVGSTESVAVRVPLLLLLLLVLLVLTGEREGGRRAAVAVQRVQHIEGERLV